MLAKVAWQFVRVGWLRFQCWRIPLTLRVELWLAARLRFGAAYHFWRAGRMMGMPRLPGESTNAYGERLIRHQLATMNRSGP